MNLRKEARGRQCYVRLPDCLPGTDTVVLAHYRLAGISGMGIKSPDVIACPACFNCHDLVDGRKHMANLTRHDVRLAHAEGVFRWQCQLLREEKLSA